MYQLAKKIRPLIGKLPPAVFIENKLISRNKRILYKPIFIVGLPRSGSTLLYQLICNNFEVSYFSNLCSLFFGYPASIIYLTKKFHNNVQIKKYKSDYGYTSGIFSPSEAGGIYRYWFSDIKHIDVDKIFNTISEIMSILNKPFVWKNLNLSYHIEILHKIFPNALFIKVERKLEFVCQSIFMKSKLDDGINIINFELNGKLNDNELLEKLVGSAKKLDQNINNIVRSSDINFLEIKYEELCSEPQSVLDKIVGKYSNENEYLKRRKKFFNKKFVTSEKIKLEKELWSKLIKSIYG